MFSAFKWFLAVVSVILLCHCERRLGSYQLSRQPLQLAANQKGVVIAVDQIDNSNELGLWSANADHARAVAGALDLGRVVVSAGEKGGVTGFAPFDEGRGFGETLPGNISLGWIEGKGSGIITIPFKKDAEPAAEAVEGTEIVIFESPRQTKIRWR
jgi:hypothetical protein